MSADRKASGGFSSQDSVVFVDGRRDPLESYGNLYALLAEALGHPVQDVCRGDIAHHRALPALFLVQIPVEHHDYLVHADIASCAVYDGKSVSVTVECDSEVVAASENLVHQRSESIFARSRIPAVEVGVLIAVDDIQRASAGVQNDFKGIGSGSVHRIEQDPEALSPDCILVQNRQNVVDVFVERILDELHLAAFHRILEIHLPDFRLLGDMLLDPVGYFHRSVTPLLHDYFQSVILGRVVACRNLDSVMEALLLHGVHDKGRRCRALHHQHIDVVGRKDLGQPSGSGL